MLSQEYTCNKNDTYTTFSTLTDVKNHLIVFYCMSFNHQVLSVCGHVSPYIFQISNIRTCMNFFDSLYCVKLIRLILCDDTLHKLGSLHTG